MMVREPRSTGAPGLSLEALLEAQRSSDDDDALGLDVHEKGFMVEGNTTTLQVGICVSTEPMLRLSGKFGPRLENIASMAEDGAHGFTSPAHTVDDSFAYDA